MDKLGIDNLISFDLVYLSDDGVKAGRHKNLTAKFDETSKAILAKQRPGDIITFESILVNENGKEVRKDAFFYTVR